MRDKLKRVYLISSPKKTPNIIAKTRGQTPLRRAITGSSRKAGKSGSRRNQDRIPREAFNTLIPSEGFLRWSKNPGVSRVARSVALLAFARGRAAVVAKRDIIYREGKEGRREDPAGIP